MTSNDPCERDRAISKMSMTRSSTTTARFLTLPTPHRLTGMHRAATSSSNATRSWRTWKGLSTATLCPASCGRHA
eukprot:2381449-Pyramimonas_sp.AAC.1